MYMYIYLNFVLVYWIQCIVRVLLGDANKKSIQRQIWKMHSYL